MPKDYPDVGLYHPDSKGKIVDSIEDLPKLESPVGTIGILLMRSYVLSGDTAHYDAVIKRFRNIIFRLFRLFRWIGCKTSHRKIFQKF